MTTLSHPALVSRPQRRFSVEEYLRLMEVGILTKHDKVELINGRIIEKISRNPPRDSAINGVTRILFESIGDCCAIRVHSSIQLSSSVPEAEIAVVCGPHSRYDHSNPTAADVLLVVEICDSTHDQGEMASTYARDGIPLYWIVNLIDRRLEVYTDPTGPDHFSTYRQRKDIPINGTITLALPGLKKFTIKVQEFFPAAG
jgi:Uma2 family endonuclease